MKAVLPLGAVVLGVTLIALSTVWALVFSPANNWTDEKSKKLAEVSEEVHLLSFKLADAKARPNMMGGVNPAELQAQYREKEAELNALKDEFNNIKESPTTVAKYLRWTGIGCVLLGGVTSMVTREG